MSKVLYLLDFREHLSFDHEDWLEEQFLEQCKKDLENGNTDKENRISEKEKFDSYVNPDGCKDFSADDIPF
tara:strand:+ start:2160 stop:2372 length:213 start_codon:yes stop_codon:yes gene_type:complete